MATKNDKRILSRTYIVATAMLLLAIVISVKLVKIQIEGDEYRAKADETTLREAEIIPNQGNLYSDDGSLLATSVVRYDIRWDGIAPSEKNFNTHIKPLSDSLSKMFGKPSSYYQNLLKKERKLKNRYLLIAPQLGYSDYLRIKKFPLFEKGPYKGGLIIDKKVKREYPLGGIAHRSIGYERTDENGYTIRVGLEGAYSNYLLGTKGRRLEQKIAKGQWKLASGFNIIEPKDGYDVVSTININIQDIAHHALLAQLEKFKAKHGCVIVMEVNSGEIKAISNLELNSKTNTYSERYNYAIGEVHEPGSIFKLMSVVAAIEERGIDTTYVVDIKNGRANYYKETVDDSQKRFTGKINIAKAFAVSSNVGMTEMVHHLFSKNPKEFTDKLSQMGLDQPLGLPIKGERTPYIPKPKDKNWSGISLEWMAFGYGLHLTPLQTLAFYNAIANNGVMVKPRLIKEVREWNKTIEKFNVEIINGKICSKETAQKAKGLLASVVEKPYGTAHKLYSSDFSMAGKTGTARKNYGSNDKSKWSYISSFAGFFPVENPKYSCIVVIHEPDRNVGYYGADVSGPVFKSIAQKIYTNSLLIDTIEDVDNASEKTNTNYNQYYTKAQKYKTIMPDVIGMAAMDAVALLENMGLKVRLIGEGKVKNQSITSGQKIGTNKNIVLTLENS
ncbi:penicillin-binding protein [Capnocytophaga cynodegmi]|uniref:Penicillin-binding protein, transpeptidase domain protein n=1 Tax=Capnocytophaga cynodegmi TaxID=28189 RepID=A0A0B7H6H4_9FLAO|nr:penicillin-binding protein [Capnocytophaga cynodegmi]CEN35186.1 Penicillin-binding protein, transpeptidase domain protein [Capnocytophaga cynodegmi]CEN35548.1 Penicillin-binding protein, transpeptidase domain protein [Capnocytophaga cynodegmi]